MVYRHEDGMHDGLPALAVGRLCDHGAAEHLLHALDVRQNAVG